MRDWRSSLQGARARNAVIAAVLLNLFGAYAVQTRLDQPVATDEFALEREPVALVAPPDLELASFAQPSPLELAPPRLPEPKLGIAALPDLPDHFDLLPPARLEADANAQPNALASLRTASPAQQEFDQAFAPQAARADDPVVAGRAPYGELPVVVETLLYPELPLAAADLSLPSEPIPGFSTSEHAAPSTETGTADLPIRAVADSLPVPAFGLIDDRAAPVG